jgi:hypothetical protein
MLARDALQLRRASQELRRRHERAVVGRSLARVEQDLLAPGPVPAQMVDGEVGRHPERVASQLRRSGRDGLGLEQTHSGLLGDLLGNLLPDHQARHVRRQLAEGRLVQGRNGLSFGSHRSEHSAART